MPVKERALRSGSMTSRIGFYECIALMALLISLTALAIDAMLPAFPQIGKELGVRQANDVQLIISTLIFGLSIGQMIYGPLSDSQGRKPVLFAGVVIFLLGCGISLFSTAFRMMLVGRILQGIGLAGPRSLVVAMIRDQYEGRTMARVMSMILSVFIVAPAVAPAIGQGILVIAGWRAIFGSLLVLAFIALMWFVLRHPETLQPHQRVHFSARKIASAVIEVCRNRLALGYTVMAGFILGAFIGYLNSASQIFQEVYRLADRFPLFFGILALSIGSASLANARLVMRFGMQWLIDRALKSLWALSISYLAFLLFTGGHSPLWMAMACLMALFFCFGILFGNLNTMAMKPLGHIAGTGAAVVGALSTLISVPLATAIGRSFDGTLVPLIAGFSLLSFLSMLIMRWADNGKK